MEPEIATKPPKKPRSEAQKKATENALNILKARREAKKEEKIRAERNGVAHSHSERNLTEKPVAAPAAAPSTEYVTKKDLEAYIASMKSKEVKPEKVKPKKEPVYSSSSESESESEPEPVVVKKKQEKVVRSRPVQRQEPEKLSGYELLDAMFFSRR